jgi:flagellar assembly protein FliH
MTSTWPETRILEADAHPQVRPARLDTHLRSSALLDSLHADPRVVDPTLARIVDDAAALATVTGHQLGFDQGYVDGLARGRADAEAQAALERADDEAALAQALERLEMLGLALTDAAARLERRAVPTYAEAGPELGPVVVELVEAMLGRELREDPTPFVDAVRRAVAEAPHGSAVHLRLHPDDLRTARDLHVDLSEIAGRPVDVVGDASVERGGAVADSGARRIDACLTGALARLRAELAP